MDESLSSGKGERKRGIEWEWQKIKKKFKRKNEFFFDSPLWTFCSWCVIPTRSWVAFFLASRVFISPSISPASLSGRAENWKVEKLCCCSLVLVYIRLRYNPERRTTRGISGKGIQIEWGKWSFFIVHNFLSLFFSSLFHRPTWMKKVLRVGFELCENLLRKFKIIANEISRHYSTASSFSASRDGNRKKLCRKTSHTTRKIFFRIQCRKIST